MSAAPAIAVEGLVRRYGERAVVDGVSFAVTPGELVALLGPNGAGTPTTVETVEGYQTADAGTVRVLGTDPARGGRDLRARIGLMLQDGGFDPRARPRETIAQFAAFHADALDVESLLALVGLDAVAATPYRRLSGGERQRLALAVALVGRPEVLVLDEPTAGMDPEARAVTRGLIDDARTAGAAILLTSHDLTDVERLADRIVVIDAGRVVATGTPAELMAIARPSVTVRLDRELASDQLGRLGLEPHGPGARYRLVGTGSDRSALAGAIAGLAGGCAEAGILILELRSGSVTLEESYLALVRAGPDESER
ncbi:MAG TPA: ABC transporter ATP-binding protein [Clostridia bacterium]|nr:ABC transporter ATP-binding protein [Clostridia bacterium]